METHFSKRPTRSVLLVSIIVAVTTTLLLAGNMLASQEFIPDTILAPQLEIDKQVDRSQVEPGDLLAYAININNSGGDTGTVVMTDTLPAGVTLQAGSVISIPQQAIINEVLITNNMISMSAMIGGGGVVSIQFDAVVDSGLALGTLLTNTAWLTGTGEMLTDSAVTLVTDIVTLDVDKQVDRAEAEPGNALGYTIWITNTSNELTDFATAYVTDTLPSTLALQPNTLVTGTNAADIHDLMLNNNTITLNGTLAGGGWISVRFNAHVSDTVSLGTTITNTVLATSAGNLWSATVTTIITKVTSYAYLPIIHQPVPVPTLQATEPTANNAWTVSWNQTAPNITGYELQEANDPNFTTNLQTYTLGSNTTSRQFQYPNPTGGAYYYRVRALVDNVSSAWSNIAPVLIFSELTLSATLPDANNDWVVSWTGGNSLVTYYELQEATNPDFTEGLKSYNTGTATSKDISHIRTADNLYYYRVRSLIGTSASPWSDSIRVVGAYKDTFLNNETNWAVRRTDTGDYNAFYRPESDHYQIELNDDNNYLIASPLGISPEIDYEIEFEGRFVIPEDRHTLGIVFGGDWNGDACPDANNNNCFNTYYMLRIQYRETGTSTFLEFKLQYIEGHDGNNEPFGPTLIDWTQANAAVPDDWNVWVVEVEGDGDIKISLDGTRLASVRDGDLDTRLGDYFGFLAQTQDVGGLKIRLDDILIARK